MASEVDQSCILERISDASAQGNDGALMGFHKENSTHVEFLPFLRLIAGGRQVVAPRSARWSAHSHGGRFSWFTSIEPPSVEPVSFGDSLMQLEALALEYAKANTGGGNVLAGIGQGGSMALSLGALWPELFSGLIAIGAEWPRVPGWEVAAHDMSNVAVLLIGARDHVREHLAERGAQVEEREETSSELALADVCRRWMASVKL